MKTKKKEAVSVQSKIGGAKSKKPQSRKKKGAAERKCSAERWRTHGLKGHNTISCTYFLKSQSMILAFSSCTSAIRDRLGREYIWVGAEIRK